MTEPLDPPARLPALDWLRGLVMVLMAIDHASEVFNAGRLVTDGIALYQPGTPLPAAQFLTRWITHLCAPTFVFLAGAALALSVERRLAAGEPARAVDRFILSRGLLIALLDPLWMSWVFVPGRILLQVLYAIGASLMAMVVLRRLPTRWLLGLASLWEHRGCRPARVLQPRLRLLTRRSRPRVARPMLPIDACEAFVASRWPSSQGSPA